MHPTSSLAQENEGIGAMGEFSNKVVVVTGGSRGIGRAIAQSFAREGAQTVLAASSQANLDAAAAAIGNSGPKPLTFAGDLKTLAACEALHAFVAEKTGRCDVLVNNAGATRSGNFLDMPDEAFHDGFALKYFACVRLSKLFWPMLKAAEGRVVNIIGGAARTPDPLFLVGGSVNAAMANFSKGLSGLGKKDGVNVNVIHPGLTETDRVISLMQQRAQAHGITPDEARKQVMEKDGLRRIGQPEDVAELALFLASDRARHIQGAAIGVDGGQTTGLF
jgi:NAD(P)-dependent dehydrogenase (short-subunit alcohol dehydrogenase family)